MFVLCRPLTFMFDHLFPIKMGGTFASILNGGAQVRFCHINNCPTCDNVKRQPPDRCLSKPFVFLVAFLIPKNSEHQFFGGVNALTSGQVENNKRGSCTDALRYSQN